LGAHTGRTRAGALLMPCGRCRQLLSEFGGPELEVDGPDGPVPLGQLLALAFGPGELRDHAAGEAP
jgi:cytidine deaminase